MKIKILAVGRLKEAYWREAVKEYVKRLSPFARIEIVEVKADPNEDIQREGRALLRNIKARDFVVSLEVDGKRLSSEEFSKTLENWMVKGQSGLVFVIGGSRGLSEELTSRSNFALSFSDMTFTHQMMRVFLLEQVYRAFQISQASRYHK